MNLVTEPWVPVLLRDGKHSLISLFELFGRADEVADLALRPHEKVSVLRLLICIVQAACDGPDEGGAGYGDPERISECAQVYLEGWKDSFELFGERRRFLQLRTSKTETVDASKLFLHLAAGNNHTLFDHAGGSNRHFPSEALAVALLTYQNFSPLIGRGYRDRSPAIDCHMVHAFRWGASLREILTRNYIPRPFAEQCYDVNGIGRPIWELSIEKLAGADAATLKTATMTYLGRLVPLTRAIWLREDGAAMVLDNGLSYPPYDEFREPSATEYLVKTKQGSRRLLLQGQLDRDLWRSLTAFTVRRLADGSFGAPLALQVTPDDQEECPLWCAALVSDYQAKILDAMEAFFVLPPELFDDAGRLDYEDGVKFAEQKEKALGDAVTEYAKRANCVPKREKARRFYWNAVTRSHGVLLARSCAAPVPDENDPWLKVVRTAAHQAFAHACPTDTARQVYAFAVAQKKFAAKSNPTPSTTAHG